MPGIVGIISRKPAAENERIVQTMAATMRHERFYLTGIFAAPELGVCTGWIAHENSFAARQAYQNEQKTIALAFSGECFVPAETKSRRKQDGHTFSETGGECLLHLYEERGETFFEELNGLFSGLLIDRRQKKVFLFNDRYGMERIYWHETPDAFYFASEAKALLRILPELREFDREGVAQFLGVGCALAGRTLFRDIRLLPGGARWTFENGGLSRKTYFSPATWEAQPKLSGPEYEARFRATFQKILPRYFESSSKIGVALTGGLDTRMIMACHPHDPQHETSYTFTGPAGQTLDDRIAARVADACGWSTGSCGCDRIFLPTLPHTPTRRFSSPTAVREFWARTKFISTSRRGRSPRCGSPAIMAAKSAAPFPRSNRSTWRRRFSTRIFCPPSTPPPVNWPPKRSTRTRSPRFTKFH
jgi:asparagine synthase (glutamine-hydrolysing)